MMCYIVVGNLLIVGNRINVYCQVFEVGVVVLVIGGFNIDDSIIELVDMFEFLIFFMSYDIFMVVVMINWVIYDQFIKKEIVFVEDILMFVDWIVMLFFKDKLEKWYEKNYEIGYGCFLVIDQQMKIYGIFILKDIVGYD